MTIPILVGTALGIVADVTLLAFGAKRLLNTRFSIVRVVVAGLVGLLVANAVISSLVAGADRNKSTAVVVGFILLGCACALLAAMIILVVAEAFTPTGSLPGPIELVRGLRSRYGRTRRYWQISRIFLGRGLGPLLRGRLGARNMPPDERARLARALAGAFDQGGVTFVKLGQVLSTRADLLPAEFVAELGRLQDAAAPVPWTEVEQMLVEELQVADLGEVFAEIGHAPLAAASIAQVHTARLRTGQDVVVKIQRPGVTEIVRRDLDIIGRVAVSLRDRAAWAASIGIVELSDGFAAALREELDFRVEVRNMAAVAAAGAQGDPADTRAVVIPRPHENLCTSRVLVMQRLTGTPLSKADQQIDRDGLDRAELARTLLDTLLRQIMIDGTFHADPHPGNILLLDDGRLGLLDFGSVGRLDTELQHSLQRTLLALNRRDPTALADALLDVMARPDELDEQGLSRALGAFMARNLGPGLTPNARMFTELFGIVSRYDLAVPPEYAAVFRALATLEGGLARLAPGFDLVAEAEAFGRRHLAERFRPEALKQAAANELLSLLPMLRTLPRRIDRIASAVEGGRLSVNVRLLADERDRRVVSGLLHQVLLTVLAATSGIMAVMLLGLKGGPEMTSRVGLYQFLGYCMLVIGSILALRVLVSVFRFGQRS
jgi:ubiquinone biosynthesis protein